MTKTIYLIFLCTLFGFSLNAQNLDFLVELNGDLSNNTTIVHDVFVKLPAGQPDENIASYQIKFYFLSTVLNSPSFDKDPIGDLGWDTSADPSTQTGAANNANVPDNHDSFVEITGIDGNLFVDPGTAGTTLIDGTNNLILIGRLSLDIVDPSYINEAIFFGTETTDEPLGYAGNDLTEHLIDIAEPSQSLPIVISKFAVSKRGESTSILDWITETEINSSHFEIERAMDGASFEKIGEKDAAGLSSSLVSYQFVDANVPLRNGETTAYYRLKMMDNDGSYEYSETRSVVFDGHGDVVTVHPNPTSDFISVDAQLEVQKVTIFDVTGKVVFNQKYDINKIDLSTYDSGMYKVVVTTEAGDQVKSIVKID